MKEIQCAFEVAQITSIYSVILNLLDFTSSLGYKKLKLHHNFN